MTCNHVIPSEAHARGAEVQFNYQLDYRGNPQTMDVYSPDPDSVFYSNVALDFTLVKLNPHCRSIFDPFTPKQSVDRALVDRSLTSTKPFWTCLYPGYVWGHLQLLNTVSYAGPSGDQPGQHLNIVQHPQGRRKEVALQRNSITNIYANRIRYTTDTEPGSSGSPVLNNQWDLVAIHHAAGELGSTLNTWLNNEGMRIDMIVADLREHYAGSTTGDQILAELGI
ncbi:MAG: serine protease [Pseudomonadota bacterium]